MDTYKRSIRGLQSRSNGEHFEGMIIAASRFYEERGIAAVDKTPEAFKVLKAMDRNRGQFICCFTKQAQPDFKGILMDSTMILFDAKHTDKDKISRDVVTTEQQACFERYMKLGAMCMTAKRLKVSHSDHGTDRMFSDTLWKMMWKYVQFMEIYGNHQAGYITLQENRELVACSVHSEHIWRNARIDFKEWRKHIRNIGKSV